MKLPSTALLLFAHAIFAADTPQFNRDVRPILSGSCFKCHGFDSKARKAELRLDAPEGAFAVRKDGSVAIKPGDPNASEVWRRISSDDEDTMMPPPGAHKPLTADEKQIIRKWIADGAKYQKHWSFEPVQRPAPPAGQKAIHAIDAFLGPPMAKAGLSPWPQADRPTLIRRVSFALTGLPPSVGDVELFLADKSPSAYEQMVDRYLGSPHYGEEMARHWLDVARYADTHGLHLDNERQMWAYRDWVVQAFNSNLPFDKFTVWQVAGDLLPNPTLEQLAATGFNRCNVTTGEGGAIDAEFRYRYAVERTTAVAQAWLGLTAGCAVCHDHKYDPLSSKEFYGLYAFFNNAADPPMDGNINTTPPFLKLPNSKQKQEMELAAKSEADARRRLDTLAFNATYRDPARESAVMVPQTVVDVLFDDVLPVGVTGRSSSRNAIEWSLDPEFKAPSGRRVIRQAEASSSSDRLDFQFRPIVVPEEATFEFWVRVDPLSISESVSIAFDGGSTISWKRKGDVLRRADAPSEELVPGRWLHVKINAKDAGLKPQQRVVSVTLSQKGGIAHWDRLLLQGRMNPKVDPLASFSVWLEMHGKKNIPTEAPPELQAIFRQAATKKLSDEQTKAIRRFYLAQVARPASTEMHSARKALDDARTARLIAEDSAPGTFVYRESTSPRDSFVMLRGQYDKPGEKVEPGVPAILPPLQKAARNSRPSRYDLANWLVAKENPLTSRVVVNRLWQQFFGVGLVKTSYDFGSQGEPPSNPDLLDWLACEFRDNGWDFKRMVRTIVLSDAFRRSSKQTPQMHAKDPENRLCARGPRFRLDAEQVRDNALFVSGLIDLSVGGRGVKPYQPPNIWEPVGYSDSNTRFYLQDHGQSLYRRSLYVFIKRTAPAPFLANFDAPNREQVCTVRERSNTPMQALQLMNDVQFFEAARALAERMLAAGPISDEERIARLYKLVLSRSPTDIETRLVIRALDQQRRLFASDPVAAAKAIGVGESKPRNVAPAPDTAAWTMVANLLLNLDETVTRN